MPCYHPIEAFQRKAGSPLSFSKLPPIGSKRLFIPCGRCIGCRLEHARQWAVRCMHHAQMHPVSCFLTLTYDDAHLPALGWLEPLHFTNFFKRLRHYGSDMSYFMCGEYGEVNSRPHYHSLVFNYRPDDLQFFRRGNAGFDVFTSAKLDRIWGLGKVFVGEVSFESAGYIARYSLKKVASDGEMREIWDVDTGEIFVRPHEYMRCSLKRPIGKSWFRKYGKEVFPRDGVFVRDHMCKPPRYYDKIFNLDDVGNMFSIKLRRALEGDRQFDDNSPRRLRVKEAVTKAAIRSLKRDL